MKYLRLFESVNKSEIDEFCERYHITNYTINPDGSIDVKQSVDLSNLLKRTILPIKFNKVYGYFECNNNRLTTLECMVFAYEGNLPIEVGGYFDCSFNELTSFKGSPKIINGDFGCRNNKIASFEYFPRYVRKKLICYDNPISWVWNLFRDTTKIELLNDFDMFRDEDTDQPAIVMERLNDFLLTIGKDPVKKIGGYKNI